MEDGEKSYFRKNTPRGFIVGRDNNIETGSLSPTQFVLMLHSIPHLGEKTLTRLLHHNAHNRLSPDACMALSPEEWQTRYALDPRSLAYLSEHRDALLMRSGELARTVRQVNLYVLTPQSLLYPDRLERFDDSPPPILYAIGNLALLDQNRQFSVRQTVPLQVFEQSDEQYEQNAITSLPEKAEPQQELEQQKTGQRERSPKKKLTNKELYNISIGPRIEATVVPTPTYHNTFRNASQTTIPEAIPETNLKIKSKANLEKNIARKLELKGNSAVSINPGSKIDSEVKINSDAVGTTGVRPFLFSIAVSNGASSATLAQQDQIAEKLVACGCVPVTGHDRPAYKRLALAAQRLNRPTIYVMDRGLREALGPEFDRPPFSAARIRDTVFDVTRDLALSSFRLDDHALGSNNRRRDRTIYALADVIIALDVRAGGGMVAECLRAHAQGRLVWVADGGRDGNEELRQAGCPSLPV